METLADYDTLLSVAERQLSGTAASLKSLAVEKLCSASTLQRRLARLQRLGAIVKTRSGHDGRISLLCLEPKLLARFKRIGQQALKS